MLSNQSKERTLVGEVISTVALAGQISRSPVKQIQFALFCDWCTTLPTDAGTLTLHN